MIAHTLLVYISRTRLLGKELKGMLVVQIHAMKVMLPIMHVQRRPMASYLKEYSTVTFLELVMASLVYSRQLFV